MPSPVPQHVAATQPAKTSILDRMKLRWKKIKIKRRPRPLPTDQTPRGPAPVAADLVQVPPAADGIQRQTSSAPALSADHLSSLPAQTASSASRLAVEQSAEQIPLSRGSQLQPDPTLKDSLNQPPAITVPVSESFAASTTDRELENTNTSQTTTEARYVPLWDRAVKSLEEAKSEHVDRLKEYLKDDDNEITLADRIGDMLNERYDRVRGKDATSQSQWRKYLQRTTKSISSTQTLGMAIARLDPHGIAPIVLGGLYCLVQVAGGSQSSSAINATMEIADLIALWDCVEELQIKRNKNSELQKSYEELSGEVVKMYKAVIVLLGTMMVYFNSKRRQVSNVLVPQNSEWENMTKQMESHEKNCNILKRIQNKKEAQERDSKILDWISLHDTRGAFKEVEDHNKIVTKDKTTDETVTTYVTRTHCQWLVDDPTFKEWCVSGDDSVLWLNGTIGTGKTTLMARAIHTMKTLPRIEMKAYPLAMFFFKKAKSGSLLSVEACLGSLLRQLSWDYATSSIVPAAERRYNDFKNKREGNSSLLTPDCLKLLVDIIAKREVYIMIDAIDECEMPGELLEVLKKLMLRLEEVRDRAGKLHLMICGRSDQSVSDYFPSCSTITTSSTASSADQLTFIELKLEERSRVKSGAMFFKRGKEFPDRLKNILTEKANGLFRWIEIQIQYFTETSFDYLQSIEEDLESIEKRTTKPELNEEYARLFNRLGKRERIRERALKMLKFIACSFVPLSAATLAEAINASEAGPTKYEMKVDDVHRYLVGFVTKVCVTHDPYKENYHEKCVLELAHSSVLEYLVDDEATDENFTTLAQHSEAAALCFAAMSSKHKQGSGPDVNNLDEVREEGLINHRNHRKYLSDLCFYSCRYWPEHCKVAFAELGSHAVVEAACSFILSDAYWTWNTLVRDLTETLGTVRYSLLRSVWHQPGRKTPGFVIVAYDLTHLLEFPEICKLVKLNDVNGMQRFLFEASLMCSKRTTVERILERCPEKFSCDIESYLPLAFNKRSPEAVERVLQSSGGNFFAMMAVVYLLKHVLRTLSSKYSDPDHEKIAKHLLEWLKGVPDMWGPDGAGWTLIRSATRRTAQQLLIEHVSGFEGPGNVQRLVRMELLRIRDSSDQAEQDAAEPNSGSYVVDQLAQAVKRDNGEILHEAGESDLLGMP
ncbi:hypothetical protein MMC07_007370, partial [Pseudocyphellaria aurata]|nr:hypothetical protein [Pseudocyphellaria aurata]